MERHLLDTCTSPLLETRRVSLRWPLKFTRFEAGDLLAPVVGLVLSLPVTIAYVGVIIAGAPELKPHFAAMLSSCMLSLSASAFRYAQASYFPTCSNVDFLTAAFFGKVAGMLRLRVPKELIFVHMLVVQGMFTTLVGLVEWGIAKMDILWVMRFLPYPVASGFNCAGGLIIMNGGLSLGTGKTLVVFIRDLFVQGPASIVGDDWLTYANFAATAICCAVFVLLLRFGVSGAGQLPAGFVIVCSMVYGLAWVCGLSHERLVDEGVFLTGLSGAPWDAPWRELASNGGEVHWLLFCETDLVLLALSYGCLISFSNILFMASLHEVMPPDPPPGQKYNFTEEIRVQGQLNVVLGLVAGIPMASSLKFWIVIKKAGTSTRLWVWMIGMAQLLLWLIPDLRLCLAVVPKCGFSGLVVSIGWGFFTGTFTESRRRIASAEWRFTVATMVVTFFNVFAGIMLGMACTIGFFLLEYSSMTGVVHSATLAQVRSFAERWPEHAAMLDKEGHKVVIFWCSGYIFFGTAATIVEEIEEQLDMSAAMVGQAVRAVIVDFERVPAVDASGVKYFMAFAANCLRRNPPVKVRFCGLTRRLQLAMREAAQRWYSEEGSRPVVDDRRIESALSWAEHLLIKEHLQLGGAQSWRYHPSQLYRANSGALEVSAEEAADPERALKFLVRNLFSPNASEAEADAFVSHIAPSLDIKQCDGGSLLFEEGDRARSLQCILGGTVTLYKSTGEEAKLYKLGRYHLNEQKGDQFVFEERGEIQFRHLQVGGWLGSLEFCAVAAGTKKAPCFVLTARVGQDGCTTLRIPFRALKKAIEAHPVVGCGLMVHISYQAGLQALELIGSTQLRPYRSSSDATFLALAEAASPTGSMPPMFLPIDFSPTQAAEEAAGLGARVSADTDGCESQDTTDDFVGSIGMLQSLSQVIQARRA